MSHEDGTNRGRGGGGGGITKEVPYDVTQEERDKVLPLMRRDDAPALKRYDPSVLKTDGMSVHASQLPPPQQQQHQRYASSNLIGSRTTGMKNHDHNNYGLSSGMRSHPPLSRPKHASDKALPRMKPSDENSTATSFIGSFHGGEKFEPSFIRESEKSVIGSSYISNDSQSILKPPQLPIEDHSSNDGTSIFKVFPSEHTVDTDEKTEESLQKPNYQFEEALLPANLELGTTNVLDPSITDGTNASIVSSYRADYSPVDPSVTDGTSISLGSSYHADYAPVDPSVTDGKSISLTSSHGTLAQIDTRHHSTYAPMDPSITSLTIHEGEPFPESITTEPSLACSVVHPPKKRDPSVASHSSVTYDVTTGIVLPKKRDPSVATNSSVTSDLSFGIIPTSVTEPLVSTVDRSTTTNELNSSAIHITSTTSDATMSGHVSNVSHVEPTFRQFRKDPSVVNYNEDIYRNNSNSSQPSHERVAETGTDNSVVSATSRTSTRNDSLSVNLVRKSSAYETAYNLPLNGHASNYFERSLIEEINHLIEQEQLDSSVLSIPMVPAVVDDATTLPPTAPTTNTGAAVGQEQQPLPSLQNNATSNRPPSGQEAVAPQRPFSRQSQPLLPRPMPMKQLSKLRQEYGLPVGLVMEVARFQKCAYTYVVFDTNDIEDNSLMECAQLAATAQSEVVFCLSNNTGSQELLYPPQMDPLIPEVQRQRHYSAVLHEYIKTIRSPIWAATPTIRTIQKLFELAQRIPRLEHWEREKVSVVIVTNRTFGFTGQPELTNFIQAIDALHQIHVRVTIRLSSLDDTLVDYYNRIKQTFPYIGLLSTFEKQRALVQKYNPWLNYGEPLHRLRELGYQFHHVIDNLSQRLLNKDEVRVFFLEFYGKKAMLYSPDIHTQWEAFHYFVDLINNREGRHQFGINPKNRQQRDYWIIIKKLDSAYATKKKSILPWRTHRSSSRSSVPLLSKRDKESLRMEI